MRTGRTTSTGATLPATTTPRDRFFGASNLRLSKFALVGHAEHLEASSEPVDWAWEGILARSHLALLGGPPAVGKTTLAAHLVVALANPHPEKLVEVLGRRVVPVPEGRFVVLVEQENGRRSIAKKLEDGCVAYGLPVVETLDRIVTIPRSLMHIDALKGGADFEELNALAKKDLIGALFLDSWATIIRADSNSEDAQAMAAAWLRILIENSGGPVVAIIHTRKGPAESLDDIAGSHQRAAAADVVLLVSAEREGGRVLSSRVVFAKLRDDDGEHPEPVTFSVGRGDDGNLKVALNASARAEDQPLHERVFALIRDEEYSSTQLREKLKCSGKRIAEAVDVLKAEKRVKFRKGRINGQESWLLRAAEQDRTGLIKSANGTAGQEGLDEQLF